jgi:CRP-like cAMP-binding protein
MQFHDHGPLNVRTLLESTGTPFRIARYPRRAALFVQGDACDSVMHIEKGRVWLAVPTPGGKRAICGVLEAGAFLGEEVTDQLLYSSEQRLAHTLFALAGCDERHPCRCALPDVSQEVIAEMVGTTRARVNAFMRKFKKRGFIEEEDGVLHVNVSPLQARFGSGVPVPTRIAS